MAKIKFIFEDENIPDKTIDNITTGITILEITEENDIELNHNCGAVCACSTCHVYVLEGGDELDEISESEDDFIDRAINPSLDSRLACQCIIREEDTELLVKIPDQKEIIGHEH